MIDKVKLVALPLALIAAVVTFVWYRNSLVHQGYKQAVRDVVQKDTQSRVIATEVAADVEKCILNGGSWSVVLGSCVMQDK